MTVSDVDSLLAGIVGYPYPFGKAAVTAEAAAVQHTPWYTGGLVGAGAAPTGGLNGATFVATSGVYTGSPGMPAAVTGKTCALIRADFTHTGNIASLMLVDRLWGNVPVVTTTGAQAITSPAWPARDVAASTNGVGVYLALEVSATTGNAGAITNTTVSYTNSSGTAGRTATIASVPATTLQGTFIPFVLQAGDIGVRSVQSVTLGTSYVSGTLHLIAYRRIATLALPGSNTTYPFNVFDLGMPTVWDNSVLQVVYYPTSTAPGDLSGSFTFTQASG